MSLNSDHEKIASYFVRIYLWCKPSKMKNLDN